MPDSTHHPGHLSRDQFAASYAEVFPALRIIAATETSAADAEDTVQQAAITAMSQLERFTPGTDFRAWMAAYVRSTARNARRAAKRRRNHETAAAETKPDTPAPTQPLESQKLSPDLRNALAALGPLQQGCFLLKVVTGLRYAEIAAAMDLPESTARSHVLRARRQLAAALTPAQSNNPEPADA